MSFDFSLELSVGADRNSFSLQQTYQIIDFVVAVLQKRSQSGHCVIKVDFIYMFICIFLIDLYELDIAFAVIEERKPGIDFLQNEFFLAAVEVHQSKGILQSAETGFNAPSQEITIF